MSLALVILTFSCSHGSTASINLKEKGIFQATVSEVLQSKGYTYLKVQEEKTEKWLVVPTINISIASKVYYREGFRMTEFSSKELNRSFSEVYFLETIATDPAQLSIDTLPVPSKSVHQEMNSPAAQEDTVINNPNQVPISDGNKITIESIYRNKETLNGKLVVISGKVTKFNERIMGKNWIHIQDGSSFDKYNDLTVTTREKVKVGETVKLQGKLVLNQDFGYGYSYEILLEEAIIITQ